MVTAVLSFLPLIVTVTAALVAPAVHSGQLLPKEKKKKKEVKVECQSQVQRSSEQCQSD